MLRSFFGRGPLLSGYILQRRYREASAFITPTTLLDIGCGHAYLADGMPALERYVGIDLHTEYLAYAAKRYPQHQFYQIDVEHEQLPAALDGATFEAITLVALLEHLANPQHIIALLTRYLAPTGRIIATTPTPWGHRVHRLGAQLGLFYQEAADDHKTIFDRASLTGLFSGAGLDILHYATFELGCNQLIVGGKALAAPGHQP
jgi:2-polyprenyl-3-methyl-5-hydroxy-6-metoxy-1,4-benzoquinol methylase